MTEQLIRQIDDLERQIDNTPKPEISRWPSVVSMFQSIPGLVGFWPMSSIQRSTGNAYDLSGQSRTLTYNGNPTYNIYNNLVPYIAFDGTGDGLTRADETDLDIIGTETIYTSADRGCTLGCWIRSDGSAPANNTTVIGKGVPGITTESYSIFNQNPAPLNMNASFYDGVTRTTATSTLTANTWHFIVARFDPTNSDVDSFLDNVKTNTSTTITALTNNASEFQIGGGASGGDFTGDISLAFLSANTLPDALITALFQQSRSLFGV